MGPLDQIHPLSSSKFNLATLGVAGFFGGEEVVEAMSTLHLYEGRRWFGWYNSPGSYNVAKILGKTASPTIFRSLFPGPVQDPATAFSLNGKQGPRYLGVLSGTTMTTGHIGYLLENELKTKPYESLQGGRITQPVYVSVVDIHFVRLDDSSMLIPRDRFQQFLSSFTIFCSIASAIASLLFSKDWFSFASILLGTFVGGISTFIVATGRLTFDSPSPAEGSPPGDGVMLGKEIIILRGKEEYVNAFTRGRFNLQFQGHPSHLRFGFCAVMYLLQFVAQLVLVPQGTLFGQLMFLASFAMAWANNCYLSSIDKEAAQTRVLQHFFNKTHRRFRLPNWTAAAVFSACFLGARLYPMYQDFDANGLLKHFLANDTIVWRKWRWVVLEVCQGRQSPAFFEQAWQRHELSSLQGSQITLLRLLLRDAENAYDFFYDVIYRHAPRHNNPDDANHLYRATVPEVYFEATDEAVDLAELKQNLDNLLQPYPLRDSYTHRRARRIFYHFESHQDIPHIRDIRHPIGGHEYRPYIPFCVQPRHNLEIAVYGVGHVAEVRAIIDGYLERTYGVDGRRVVRESRVELGGALYCVELHDHAEIAPRILKDPFLAFGLAACRPQYLYMLNTFGIPQI
jgi:hypothetical protein